MKSFFRIKGLFILFILIFLAALWSLNLRSLMAAPQPPSIGQVVWVKGPVKAINTEGQSRDLQRRSPIFTKDTIVTDKTSTGQVVFSDNSSIALTTDSAVRIDDYQFGKNIPPKKSKFVASLVKGGFRTVTGLIPKQNTDNYQVNTPVATIGVRGTSYLASLKGGLYLKYLSGKPCVINAKGSFCLDEKNKFAEVASRDSAPIKLSNDPGVFSGFPEIIEASFTDGLISPGSLTPGGGSGGGSLSPKNNSFCIQ